MTVINTSSVVSKKIPGTLSPKKAANKDEVAIDVQKPSTVVPMREPQKKGELPKIELSKKEQPKKKPEPPKKPQKKELVERKVVKAVAKPIKVDTATTQDGITLSTIDFKLVQIQTTSVCNARCVVCGYRNSWMFSNKGYMSDELYKKIIGNIAKLDINFDGKLCLYLMNEPFADPKLIERIQYAWENLHNPFVETSSNISLLNKAKIQEIVDLYIEFGSHGQFIVSHFGIDKESFERTMKLPYEKCLNNMVELIQTADGKIPILINNLGVSRDKRLTFFSGEEVERYINDLIEKHSLPTKNLRFRRLSFHQRAGNVKLDTWAYPRVIRQIDKEHPFDCKRIHNNLHVLWNGETILCCMDYGKEEVFGDLNNQTIEQVFNSKQWKDICGRITGSLDSKPDFICKKCMSVGG